MYFFFINVDMHMKYVENKKNKSKIYKDANIFKHHHINQALVNTVESRSNSRKNKTGKKYYTLKID